MTLLLRPATRQAARLASLALRTTARPSTQVARISRLHATATFRSLHRCYSTEPPRKPEQDESKPQQKDEQQKEAKAGESAEEKNVDDGKVKTSDSKPAERKPLPAGWVYLKPEEVTQLVHMLSFAPESQQRTIQLVISQIQQSGAPQELRDLILKSKVSGLSIADSMTVLRVTIQLAQRAAGDERDQTSDQSPGDQNQMFTQNQSKQAPREENKNQQNESKQGQQGGPQGKQPLRRGPNDVLFWAVAAAIMYPLYGMLFGGDSAREITWQELRKNFLDKGLVEKLVVNGSRVQIYLNREATQSMYPDSPAGSPYFHYYFTIGSVDAFENQLNRAQDELGIMSSDRIPVSYTSAGMGANLLISFGPPVLLVGLLYLMSRRGGGVGGSSGFMGFGKSRAKQFNHESAVKVKFADVAGMDEAKTEIMEFVSFLKSPEKFQRLGAKIPRGAILSGPPGTGKTLLAKATAGESAVPFFSVSGSEFVEMFVGVGASRVRDLFATARKNAPCIIFIDEIDAIGRSRAEGGPRTGGNDEREATLNQILTEMDGFNTAEQVVVLAGTNRPDVLDKALMRPGRFDRHIHIDRPTMQGRVDIFKVYLPKIVTKEDMDFLSGRLAALTPGFAGADIANVVNEAALVAARANAETIEMKHFEQAIERVVGGLERKSLVLNPQEKRTVAYHEAGHAICGWFFEYADPLLKVSIIPRGQGALGYAQYLPTGDAYLMNVKQLMDRMAMTLGGRISEELHFDTVTTGASDDFKKVTRMASAMVTQWGMSEKLGPLHFNNDENQLHKPFAEATGQTIDSEVRRIVDQAYQQCKDLLTAKKKEIGIVAEELLKKEMLTRDDLVRLLGPRPFKDKEEFTKYFNNDNGKGTPPPPPPVTENTDSPEGDPQPVLFKA